jgi:hypothetical protein
VRIRTNVAWHSKRGAAGCGWQRLPSPSICSLAGAVAAARRQLMDTTLQRPQIILL